MFQENIYLNECITSLNLSSKYSLSTPLFALVHLLCEYLAGWTTSRDFTRTFRGGFENGLFRQPEPEKDLFNRNKWTQKGGRINKGGTKEERTRDEGWSMMFMLALFFNEYSVNIMMPISILASSLCRVLTQRINNPMKASLTIKTMEIEAAPTTLHQMRTKVPNAIFKIRYRRMTSSYRFSLD